LTGEDIHIQKLKTGCNESFRLLIQETGPRLFSKAEQMLGNPDDAKECVQDCYVQVHKNIGTFRGEAKLFSWMYRILINACLAKMRTRLSKQSESFDDLLPKFDSDGCRIEPLWQKIPSAEELIQTADMKKHVRSAISTLPDSYRYVLLLRDIEGHSTAEVANMLSLSETATKVRLHRARSMLKKTLEPAFLEGQI